MSCDRTCVVFWFHCVGPVDQSNDLQVLLGAFVISDAHEWINE